MAEEIPFVKIPRDLFYTNKKSPFYGHATTWLIFTAILPKVRFGDAGEYVTCWGSVPIKPKEFLLNQKQLCWETGLRRATVHDNVKKLEKMGVIIKKDPAYLSGILPGIPLRHRVPILYALSDKLYSAVYETTPAYPSGTVSGIPLRHHKKKEEEKEKNQKKEDIYIVPTSLEVVTTEIVSVALEPVKIKRQSTETPPTDLQTKIAKEWLRIAFSYFPWREGEGKWTEVGFAYDLSKVQKKMGLSDDQLGRVFEIYRNSDFWRDKIIPSTLLSKTKSGIRKIEFLMKEETKVHATARRNEQFLAEYLKTL